MGSVKSRLKEIIDSMGVKPYSLESTCEGVTKSMLQNLWNSPTDTVTSNVLEPFCKAYPEVNCNYLLRGEGEMFLNNTSSLNNDKYFKICKLLLENRNKENELYSQLAELMKE